MINDTVRHSIYVQRFASGRYNNIVPFLKKLRDELITKVTTTNYQLARSNIMIHEIDQMIEATVKGSIQPSLFNELEQFAEYEAEWSLKLLDKSTVSTVTIGATVNPNLVAYIMTKATMELDKEKPMTLNDLFTKFSTSMKRDVRSVIDIGIGQGETSDVIARKLKDIVNNRTIQQAKAVVLTAASHVASQARKETFKEYEYLFVGDEWVSILDGRTSPICMRLSGQIFPIGEGPYPPQHYNERSVRVPKLKPEYDLNIETTQASQGGQVPANWTYNDWLKRQSASVQNEILGETRAKAYRKSKEPIDKFIDNSGKFYTLKELRSADLIK